MVSGARQGRKQEQERACSREFINGLIIFFLKKQLQSACVCGVGRRWGPREAANDLPEPAVPPAGHRCAGERPGPGTQGAGVAVLPSPLTRGPRTGNPRRPTTYRTRTRAWTLPPPAAWAPPPLPSRTLASASRLALVVALAQQTGLRPIPFPSPAPRAHGY